MRLTVGSQLLRRAFWPLSPTHGDLPRHVRNPRNTGFQLRAGLPGLPPCRSGNRLRLCCRTRAAFTARR